MKRQELEEIRQRECNETALQAIGLPKKRLKLVTDLPSGSNSGSEELGGNSLTGNSSCPKPVSLWLVDICQLNCFHLCPLVRLSNALPGLQ